MTFFPSQVTFSAVVTFFTTFFCISVELFACCHSSSNLFPHSSCFKELSSCLSYHHLFLMCFLATTFILSLIFWWRILRLSILSLSFFDVFLGDLSQLCWLFMMISSLLGLLILVWNFQMMVLRNSKLSFLWLMNIPALFFL